MNSLVDWTIDSMNYWSRLVSKQTAWRSLFNAFHFDEPCPTKTKTKKTRNWCLSCLDRCHLSNWEFVFGCLKKIFDNERFLIWSFKCSLMSFNFCDKPNTIWLIWFGFGPLTNWLTRLFWLFDEEIDGSLNPWRNSSYVFESSRTETMVKFHLVSHKRLSRMTTNRLSSLFGFWPTGK